MFQLIRALKNAVETFTQPEVQEDFQTGQEKYGEGQREEINQPASLYAESILVKQRHLSGEILFNHLSVPQSRVFPCEVCSYLVGPSLLRNVDHYIAFTSELHIYRRLFLYVQILFPFNMWVAPIRKGKRSLQLLN